MIIHKLVMNVISFITKFIPKNLIIDERLTIPVVIKRQMPGIELLHPYRNSRIEITQNPLRCAHRHTPDSEKPKDMVNPHRIKILLQRFETVLPPTVTVCFHSFPVVRRELPVLAQFGELIWWCTGLKIHSEKFRLGPGFHRISVDSDR